MKANQTDEFELVLGNKQVLSGFFIVVILFGVFFTMGYIVGRNSAPSLRSSAPENPTPAVSNPPAQPQQPRPETQAPVTEPPKTATSRRGETDAAGPTRTQPAREPEAATGGEAADASDSNAAQLAEPVANRTYLQVMAVKKPEAEAVVKTLKDKGFPAVLAPGPGDLIRVLVGPFNDASAIGRAKGDLESAGFHPIVRR